MGDAMSENQRDMEALALDQHFGKRTHCLRCALHRDAHTVDGSGKVWCSDQTSHSGFSMGRPRKTRHRIKPKHRARGRWVKLGGSLRIPDDADGVELVAVEGNKAKLRPITFDNGGCQVDNAANTPD